MLLAVCYRETTSADNCPVDVPFISLLKPSRLMHLQDIFCLRLDLLPADSTQNLAVESKAVKYGYGHPDPLWQLLQPVGCLNDKGPTVWIVCLCITVQSSLKLAYACKQVLCENA